MVLIDGSEYLTEEEKRLKEDRERTKYWKKWGPYVAERQWATVREDYSYVSNPLTCHGVNRADTNLASHDGDAWSREYFDTAFEPSMSLANRAPQTSRMTCHAAELIDGVKMASLVFPTPTVCKTLPLLSGTRKSMLNPKLPASPSLTPTNMR